MNKEILKNQLSMSFDVLQGPGAHEKHIEWS
jgi:hypothetical protein